MERIGQMVQIVDRDGLNRHVELWQNKPPADAPIAPIGYILSLEGADSICSPAHLERAYEYGLRALGPAHYGEGRYAPGTGSEGGLTAAGSRFAQANARAGDRSRRDASHRRSVLGGLQIVGWPCVGEP